MAPSDQIRIFVDGSQSMSGYAAPSLGTARPLPDLIRLLTDWQGRRPAEYFAFGGRIAKIADIQALQGYATPAPYNCRGSGCDNQESRIDEVLRRVADDPSHALDVIVTDLWLDNSSFEGSPQVALGRPLQQILRQGRAIGLVGIRAPFRGAVYDIPGAATYRDARERPLFLILAGAPDQIESLVGQLRESNSPAFSEDRLEFSLFSSAELPPRPIRFRSEGGGGVSRSEFLGPGVLRDIPKFELAVGLAEARGGQLISRVDPREGLQEGATSTGRLQGRAHAWRLADEAGLADCSSSSQVRAAAGTWQNFGMVNRAWREVQGGTGAEFALRPDHAQSLIAPGIYYVQAQLATVGVRSAPPENAWIREWSLSSDQAAEFAASRPTTFKALELASFAQLMEAELNRQLEDGRVTHRSGFVLRVER